MRPLRTRAVYLWASRLGRGYVADLAGCSSMLLRPMCYGCLLHPASPPVLFCWLPSFCQHSPSATTRTCHSSFGFPLSSPSSLSVSWCRHGGRRGQGRQRARQNPSRRSHQAAAASLKLQRLARAQASTLSNRPPSAFNSERRGRTGGGGK